MMNEDLNMLFDLGASNVIDPEAAALQTKTCAKLISMLAKVPGVILGDDVGMGKTYVALGVAMNYLAQYPDKKIFIITPSWQMNNKWQGDLKDFLATNINNDKMCLSESDIGVITKEDKGIVKIRDKCTGKRIVLIPINALVNNGSIEERSLYFSCWCRHKRLSYKLPERFAPKPTHYYYELDNYKFEYEISSENIPDSWYEQLDEIYSTENLKKPLGIEHFKKALDDLRYRVLSKSLGQASLLILDEAHKLKNEAGQKRNKLIQALSGTFAKGLFLTATPFQLGEKELQSIFNLFKIAAINPKQRAEFDKIVASAFAAMDEYIYTMQEFDGLVHSLSAAEGSELEHAISFGQQDPLTYDVNEAYKLYNRLLELKVATENSIGQLIVRNIKQKAGYRQEIIGALEAGNKNGLALTEEAYIPLALMEKSIAEIIMSGNKTFIANIKQSFTSSFEALYDSSIMDRPEKAVQLLKKFERHLGKHPKLDSICQKVLDLQEHGEKTLIFCDRLKTISALESELKKRFDRNYLRNIKKLFPDNGEEGFKNYCGRFYSKNDRSWFLLQENYIEAVLKPILRSCGQAITLIPTADDLWAAANTMYEACNQKKTANYMYVKRIVEHLSFKYALAKIPDWQSSLANSPSLLATANSILADSYVEFGLGVAKPAKNDEETEPSPQSAGKLSRNLITFVKSYSGIWAVYAEQLNTLDPVERETVVDKMISFLRSDKRFFIQLRRRQVQNAEKKLSDSELIKRTFASGKLLDWEKAYSRFLKNYCSEDTKGSYKDSLKHGLRNNQVVDSITGDTSVEAKEHIVAGFNSPFYPQILIATSVMQEGMDLQRECKQVIHYDMEWNPASMEQRIGRVDRIGSLVSELRREAPNVTLDIYYPFIKNTIDENIYIRVKDREKWFNLLLGGTPQWDTFDIDFLENRISPDVFKQLQVDLSVK